MVKTAVWSTFVRPQYKPAHFNLLPLPFLKLNSSNWSFRGTNTVHNKRPNWPKPLSLRSKSALAVAGADPLEMAEDWNRTALLVIDMQKDFIEDGRPMLVKGGKYIVPNVIKAVDVARQRGILIVWVVREHDPLGTDVELFRRHHYAAGKVGPTSKGSEGAELVDGLVIKEGDYKLEKTRLSVQTPNCIRQTVCDAVALDYQPVTVIVDATAAATPDIHLANVFDMKNIGVATPTLQEWSEPKWCTGVQFQDSRKVLTSLTALQKRFLQYIRATKGQVPDNNNKKIHKSREYPNRMIFPYSPLQRHYQKDTNPTTLFIPLTSCSPIDTEEQTIAVQAQDAGPIAEPISQTREQEENAEATDQQVQLVKRPKRVVTKPSYLKDYKDFIEDWSPVALKGGKDIVPNVIKAVEVARQRGILIVWVVRENDPLGRDVELFRRHHYTAGKVGPANKGSEGAELVDGLVIKEGDYKLVKTRFSAFFATHLHSVLQGAGINNLVVTGVQTPNCIRQTVFDAVSLDYQPVTVIVDATAAATPDVHQGMYFSNS
ncbi:putative inactive nicotinamidase [Glycine max]|nr:putative inactive nicotinamidase [Glycine max]